VSVTWIVLVAIAILFVNLAVNGLLLWLTCKLCGVESRRGSHPTYFRSVATAFMVVVFNVAINVISWLAIVRIPAEFQLISVVPLSLLSLASIPLAIALVLRPTIGKTLLVSVVWTVLNVLFGVGIFFAMRTNLAEAFVIPTGAMADTLFGYHKEVICPKCSLAFQVNASAEVERQPPEMVTGCVCPNCRYELQRKEVPVEVAGGDRVLVAKGLTQRLFGRPGRFDIVVFDYPEEPIKNNEPIRYIKRLVGLPGETIGIHNGKLYYLDPSESAHYDDGAVRAEDLRRQRYMHVDEPREVYDWLKNHEHFKIIRKTPDQIDALKRIVYDDEHPASDLPGPEWKRWTSAEEIGAWKESSPHGYSHAASSKDQIDWLRYHHILREGNGKAELITDFLGYNSYVFASGGYPHSHPETNWVGDLLIECEATVEQADGEFLMELSKGVERFLARWDLASGECTIQRVFGQSYIVLGKQPSELRTGTHLLRFANVDDRLVVWVGKSLPFGDGVAYDPPLERGPTRENDLEPAQIGVRKGGVTIRKLKLWRDNYYTIKPGFPDANDVNWSDPADWQKLRDLPAKTFYVQPKHYFCLGDNSAESSDSRSWGLVPEKMMIGRALAVYYPFPRVGSVK
jgi:signal peptidase I